MAEKQITARAYTAGRRLSAEATASAPPELELEALRRENRALAEELRQWQRQSEEQREALEYAQTELTRLADRNTELYDFAPTGYVSFNPKGKILQSNLSTARLLGIDRRRLLRSSLMAFIDGASQDEFYRHCNLALESDVKQTCEISLRHADGSLVRVRLESLAGECDGQLVCASSLTDISTVYDARLRLQEGQALLGSFYASSTFLMGVAEIVAGAVKIVHGNLAAADYLGSPWEYLPATEPVALSVSREIDRLWYRKLQRSQAEGRAVRFEYEHPLGTGKRWLSATVAFLGLAHGRARFSFVAEDITEHKEAQNALRQRADALEQAVAARTRELTDREVRLRAILDTAADAIVTFDARGIIESANLATVRLFGHSELELLGKHFGLLAPVFSAGELPETLPLLDDAGEPCARRLETVGRRADGSSFPIELSICWAQPCFTGILRDISERKELQRHVLEITAEEQRRIGYELHDGVQQELTGLTLIAGALAEQLDALPQEDHAESEWRRLDESAWVHLRSVVERLVQRLGESSRHVHALAHGIMPVQIDAQGLRSALDDLAAATNFAPGVTCTYTGPAAISVANNMVATHLYRIAQEAVNNATRHSQAQAIEIFLRQNGRELTLEITDNGQGMPPAGARPQPGPRPREGMGLRTMRYRAELIGGTLQVRNRSEGGTAVVCTVRQGSHS